MTSRKQILSLFNKGNSDIPPIFSGLINVTTPGLESESLGFHETHRDAVVMAQAAASTYRVSGFGLVSKRSRSLRCDNPDHRYH